MEKTLCAALAAALCLSVLSACGPGQAEKQVDLSAFAQTLHRVLSGGAGSDRKSVV